MSSTTERLQERGQVIILFALGLVALFLAAALAFDVGSVLLERRTEQNVADAAALAGARYVQTAASFAGTCASTGTNPSVIAACDVARKNNPGLANSNVLVNIPPIDGQYKGVPAVVEVRISTNKGSIFGGIIGRSSWAVGVTAVAANQKGISYGFGMLALDPTGCKAILISGTGQVNSAGNVQANSDGSASGCGGVGFSRTGSGVLNVTASSATCRSAGTIQDQGAGSMNCAKSPNSFALPDPLRNLPAPAQPALAPAMKEWVGSPGTLTATPTNIPDYCPGATGTKAASATSPHTCVMGNGASQKNRNWVLYPGLYPGGINASGNVTLYLMPGIYWIGGGGLNAADVTVMSVDDENDRTRADCTSYPCVGGGGVLIYNSKLPAMAAGPIALGGNGVILSLMPYKYPFGDPATTADDLDLVIFQDRTVALTGDDIVLNGASSIASDVRGIVYAPQGDVKVNGSSSVFSMDQVIAYTFKINGSGGTVNILRQTGVDAKIEAVGLVE